jgi:hypothetical protein
VEGRRATPVISGSYKKHLLEAAERGDAEAQFNLRVTLAEIEQAKSFAQGRRPCRPTGPQFWVREKARDNAGDAALAGRLMKAKS